MCRVCCLDRCVVLLGRRRIALYMNRRNSTVVSLSQLVVKCVQVVITKLPNGSLTSLLVQVGPASKEVKTVADAEAQLAKSEVRLDSTTIQWSKMYFRF